MKKKSILFIKLLVSLFLINTFSFNFDAKKLNNNVENYIQKQDLHLENNKTNINADTSNSLEVKINDKQNKSILRERSTNQFKDERENDKNGKLISEKFGSHNIKEGIKDEYGPELIKKRENIILRKSLDEEYESMLEYFYMVMNHTFYIKNQTFQKSDNPKISIIIATCNGELYINNTLFSIQNQDFTDVEIVIVDDMSEDNTVNIVKELMKIDPRIQLYINEDNKGTIYTKTKGVLKSTGKYVMILDQDDMYTQKDVFSTLYNYMEEQNFDILGFSAIFTKKFPFKKPGYVHYYFERPIIYHPELSRQMFAQYGKSVRKVGWYIWNFIFKNDLFKRTINQIDEKIINTKMNRHEDIILFFLLTRNANNLKQIRRIFYSQNHFENLNKNKANEKYINDRRNNNNTKCLSNINLIEFLLKYTKDEIGDKRIASYELNKAYLDNDCRNCDYIKERGIFVCNLFLENKYIEDDIKNKIYKFLNKTDKIY